MHTLTKAAWVAAGLLAVAGCKPSAPNVGDTKADEDAVRSGAAAWAEAYSKGDIDAILALYAGDAVLMPPGAHAAGTPDAMRDFLTTDIATSAGTTLDMGDSTTGVAGDFAWQSGTYSVKNSAGATVDTGKYLAVWHRVDGKWLILRNMWNLDTPRAPLEMPAAPGTN
ncbi:MAG: hypothetical protein CMLOHMNK_01991 [Steroidobacteraceae bacterium]|nr:hypothetical protein [Steroidobacteraceae bacterium]